VFGEVLRIPCEILRRCSVERKSIIWIGPYRLDASSGFLLRVARRSLPPKEPGTLLVMSRGNHIVEKKSTRKSLAGRFRRGGNLARHILTCGNCSVSACAITWDPNARLRFVAAVHQTENQRGSSSGPTASEPASCGAAPSSKRETSGVAYHFIRAGRAGI